MIFISYRKEDSQAIVDFLAEKLKQRFGQSAVFKDDRDIRAGEEWPQKLLAELQARHVLLAVIGSKWLTAFDQHGRRRIDDEKDWVRQEICTALEARKRVIVILANDAAMPSAEGLPQGSRLLDLLNLQYLRLRSGADSEGDVRKIIEEIEKGSGGAKQAPLLCSSRYRVIAFDLDGTLIRGPEPFSWKQIWDALGYSEKIRKFGAKKYLKGEWTHQQWCSWACDMFRKKGLTREALRSLGKSMKTPANLGETLLALKEAGFVLGLISGGIDVFLVDAMPDAFQVFDYVHINRLHFDNAGIISGVDANNFDFEGKVDALIDICSRAGCDLKQAVFVGEGFNDMAVLRRAGLGIAFAPVSEGVEDIAIVLDEWDLALIPQYLT